MAQQSALKQIRSVNRAITVLQAVNRQGALTISEISKAVNLSYATTNRIVWTLVSQGILEREPARKSYRPTALVQSLSCGYSPRLQLVGVARPHIETLTKISGWPVSLSSRVGQQMVLQDSTHALTTQTFSDYLPGYSMPILKSAAGLAYLAALPLTERKLLLDQLFTDIPSDENDWMVRSLKSRGDSFFDEINERGYAVYLKSNDTKNPGKTSSLAVPLFCKGDVVGTLILIFFASALSPQEAFNNHGPAIQEAQKRINQELNEIADAA